jgi:hypothetical protein
MAHVAKPSATIDAPHLVIRQRTPARMPTSVYLAPVHHPDISKIVHDVGGERCRIDGCSRRRLIHGSEYTGGQYREYTGGHNEREPHIHCLLLLQSLMPIEHDELKSQKGLIIHRQRLRRIVAIHTQRSATVMTEY